jgi:hypothetical protein
MTAKRGSGTPDENYLRERYDRINLRLAKGMGPRLKRLADAAGLTQTGLIERWIEQAEAGQKKK